MAVETTAEGVMLRIPAQPATQAPTVLLGPRMTHLPQTGGGTTEARVLLQAVMVPLIQEDQKPSQTDLTQTTTREDYSTSWNTCKERDRPSA